MCCTLEIKITIKALEAKENLIWTYLIFITAVYSSSIACCYANDKCNIIYSEFTIIDSNHSSFDTKCNSIVKQKTYLLTVLCAHILTF